MGPKTKGDLVKPLLGQPDSALSLEFLLAVQEGKPYDDLLPFSKPSKPQLPSTEQVLKLYMYFREVMGNFNTHVSKLDIMKKVAGHVILYWNMAGFKTIVFHRIVKNVEKALEDYHKIVKNISRTSTTEVAKREKYMLDLQGLFDVATPGLEDMLNKDRILGKDDDCTLYREKEGYTRKIEDVKFLQDQRGERKMFMGERDQSYEDRVDTSIIKKKQRLDMEEGVRKVQAEKITKKSTGLIADEGGVEDSDPDEDDSDYTEKSRRKVKKDNKVLIELPRDLMNSPEMCAMLDRTGTTSRMAIGEVLKSGKIDGKEADLSEFSLSSSGLERKRIQNRTVLMRKAMEDFNMKKPKYAALHWDGAMFKDVTGTLQEHEFILVSGAPHYIEGKILSVTKLTDDNGAPTSTGEAQASAVLQQIQDWQVNANIVAFVFDTTASNSGRVKGATVRLQKALARPILFLGCRHHISELIVKACWYTIFEADLSPDCKFFADIKSQWSSLDTSSEVSISTLELEESEKKESVEFYMELLVRRDKRNEMAIRDDYRELAECALVLLGEQPPSGKVIWKKPGACHKARFCAFGIYSLKALAFASQLDLDSETIQALRQFCRFTTTIYIPHFLASSIGCDSTVNDLQLYQKLFAYKKIDIQLAEAALVVLRRHGWYLTPEVAVFSMFSNKLSMDEKSRVASRLLTHQANIPEKYKLEKPKFPLIDEKTVLVDLLSSQSFKFFTVLGLDWSWMAKDPEQWEEDDDYRAAKEFVKTVKVTNDVAERGVKMAADYATILTKDDKVRAQILQSVENCRQKYPNFRKKTLNGQ